MKNKIVNNSEGKDYTTGCLLDYGYIQSHYELIAVNLGRQKELDADPKAIQQIEFVAQLKKWRWCCWWYPIHVCFNNVKKINKKKIKTPQGSFIAL